MDAPSAMEQKLDKKVVLSSLFVKTEVEASIRGEGEFNDMNCLCVLQSYRAPHGCMGPVPANQRATTKKRAPY